VYSMQCHKLFLILLLSCTSVIPAKAQGPTVVGGDTFVSGTNAALSAPAARDAFMTGFAVDVTQNVQHDLGAAAFDLDVSAPVGGDAYLAGFSIEVDQPISEDLTATGFNIHVSQNAPISGNARLAGGTVTVDGPLAGSLIATAGTLTLNGPITGDARLLVQSLTFGSGAKINGRLTYSATKPLSIPTSVIDPARVTFQQLATQDGVETAREVVKENVPVFWWGLTGALVAFAVSIAFLTALAAALLAFMPERMEALRSEAIRAPVKTMALGVLGLSMSIGLVPVGAVTLIGIPLMPIALLSAIVFWVLGYVIGAYALTTRIFEGFQVTPLTMGTKLLALALGFVILALLNFIPVVGWLLNLAIVFLGLGSIVMRAARSIVHEEPTVVVPAVESVSAIARQPASRRGRK
jgi:hypothetical protein